MSGQWLGLIPDIEKTTIQARASRCEAIAIQSAMLIRQEKFKQLEAILRTIQDRDPDIVSVGVQKNDEELSVDTGSHTENWQQTQTEHPSDAIHVPLSVHGEDWEIQFAFKPVRSTAFLAFLKHPVTKLVGFFSILGLCVYTYFVARVMGLVNSTQIVPDRVQQALDTLAEGLLVLDEEEKIVLANKAFSDTVRESQDDLSGRTASGLAWVHGEDKNANPESNKNEELAPLKFPWMRSIESQESSTDEKMYYELKRGSRKIFSINSAPIIAPDGSHRGALATFRDVTQIEEHREQLESMLAMLKSNRDEITRKNQELEILATQDSLTGCLNRRAFFEKFDQEWQKAKRGQPLSCIMVDNDHFKSVNDNYGHHTGDEVLRKVSGILRNLHKNLGIVCRYGGEEFCILLPGKTLEQAARQAEIVRQEIEAVRFDEPAELRLTASLGVSDLRFKAPSPQDMINQADVCLYVAKRSGRNQVVCYEPSMEEMEIDDSKVSRTKEEEEETAAIPFQAVTALVSALAYRDADTAEHSRRVADLCVLAADGLLDHSRTYILEIAALLHDIGKIGVPDNVLLKPGKLTPEEWKLMGRHDRIGVEIVAGTFNCASLAEIIRTHHSFFGGKARDPHLPTGEDIPVEARLLSIADSYDAMISDRVYRKGRSHEEAVAELKRCSGTQFDPLLVQHFVQAVDQYQRQNERKLTVPKQTALQIGLQIERLAEAVDRQDSPGLQAIAERLGAMARRSGIDKIAEVADLLEQEASQPNSEWMSLLEITQTLLDLCRSTQNAFLDDEDGARRTSEGHSLGHSS